MTLSITGTQVPTTSHTMFVTNVTGTQTTAGKISEVNYTL